MSADLRVPQAREFLASARRRKVGELPPSVLMRELAEARRQLGQLLDWIDESVVLDGGQLEVAGQAIADALDRRQPSGQCTGCDDDPAGLCSEHAADLDQCDVYIALGRELGIEVGQ